MFSLRYGPESQLRLELPASIEIFDHSSPQGLEIADPAAAVIEALAAPLDYPPLTAATVPGDRVVVAVDCTVPQAGKVLEGCLRTLIGGQTRPEDIRVLTNGDTTFAESLLQWAPGDVRYAIKVTRHDPDDKQSHAYLAATEEGNPIHVNRLLVDADVVLPVGVLRLDSSLAYYGSAGTIFPSFADRETQKRYERSETDDRSRHEQARRKESQEVAWLLGAPMTLQIIPGRQDALLGVIAGEIRAIDKEGQRLCQQAWNYRLPHRAGLVVATIGGGPSQQTWEGFARALDAALDAVAEQGAVVLCTSLSERPGPAMKSIASWSGDKAVPKRIRRDLSGDGLSAFQIADTRERVHVYLMSDLPQAKVEELGLGHVTGPDEIARLCRQYDSCALLGDAQYAAVTIAS
ncbi:MAG: hypothetical protein RIS70_120 [Planctomycetota bacterium]